MNDQQRAAMQMALKALEALKKAINDEDGWVLNAEKTIKNLEDLIADEWYENLLWGEALAQPQGEPVGYIDAEQFRRWDVLRGTEFESQERCYMPFSKVPFKSDMTDCSLPIYTTPPSVEANDYVLCEVQQEWYVKGWKDAAEKAAKICDRFQERDVGMQPAECAAAIRSMK